MIHGSYMDHVWITLPEASTSRSHAREVNCGSGRACSRGSSSLAYGHTERSAAHVPPQPCRHQKHT